MQMLLTTVLATGAKALAVAIPVKKSASFMVNLWITISSVFNLANAKSYTTVERVVEIHLLDTEDLIEDRV